MAATSTNQYPQEEPVALPTLYHFSYSTCSQKVRMALAEKGQDFDSREVNLLAGEQHQPEYVRLNPDHVVPTMVHRGEVLTESTLINAYIDEAFPGVRLRSADPVENYRAAAIIQHVDTRLHGKITAVFSHGVVTHAIIRSRPPAAVEAYLEAIPNPEERRLRASLIEHGTQAPEMAPAVVAMVAFFARLESLLGKQPWLSGGSFGLADICVLPYVARLSELRLGAFWSDGAAPRVERWLATMTERPSFEMAFTRWTPAAMASNARSLGEAARPAIEAIIKSAQKQSGA
ncbi:MAG TPA: glutathione S-transferase family protein [Steroidobacteraceae bacterium]|nr:glutathione S-transferase family protein [Steroidobacteraceae bacterium]